MVIMIGIKQKLWIETEDLGTLASLYKLFTAGI